MPGRPKLHAPTVLPFSLCRSFVHSREYPVQVNEYRSGESQRGRLADTSRKRWRLEKRLTVAELETLRDFYDTRNGPQEPFWFYDVRPSPFSYDLWVVQPRTASSGSRADGQSRRNCPIRPCRSKLLRWPESPGEDQTNTIGTVGSTGMIGAMLFRNIPNSGTSRSR
jgi:hypothetical protein